VRSNFDTPMELTNGVVEACGELDWKGETGVSVMVTLIQRQHHAHATASSKSFEPPADEWMVEFEATGANGFSAGPAHAIGVLSAVDKHGVTVFHWSQDVRLGEE